MTTDWARAEAPPGTRTGQSIVGCFRRGGGGVGKVGEARGGRCGEEQVLADAGADALLLALAERPAVEGDDAVGEAALREPVVQPHPARNHTTRSRGERGRHGSARERASKGWKGRAPRKRQREEGLVTRLESVVCR